MLHTLAGLLVGSSHFREITPANTGSWAEGSPPRYIRVGDTSTGTTIVMENDDGTLVVKENVYDGEIFTCRPVRVRADNGSGTDTDVGNIVGYW